MADEIQNGRRGAAAKLEHLPTCTDLARILQKLARAVTAERCRCPAQAVAAAAARPAARPEKRQPPRKVPSSER